MTRPMTVSVFDQGYRHKGQVPKYQSVSVSWDWLAAGAGTLIVAESDPVAQILLAADVSPAMVVATVGGQRWSGRAASCDLDFDGPEGTGTVTATLVDEWAWLQYMLAMQSGAAAVTTTMPQYDPQTGPAATVAAYYINAAAHRLGVPVAAVAPAGDASQTIKVNARATPLADLLAGPLTTAGISCPGTIWLPGDDQPPGLQLQTPTVVFRPQQVTPKPWLRWSRARGGIVKGKLTVTAGTGYRAVLGLNTPTADDPSTRQFDSYVDTGLQAQLGPYALPEVYVDASDAALGVDSQARGAQELAGKKPTVAASVEVIDGSPWKFGRDYFAGDVGGLEVAGVAFSERITRVTAADDRSNGFTVTPTVGDSSAAATSDELMIRALANIATQLRNVQAGR
jgi:hypothetical protein